MNLSKNELQIKIFKDGIIIKNIEHLHASITVNEYSFNTAPSATIKIKGLDVDFIKKLVSDLNPIGLVPARYAVEVYAKKSGIDVVHKVFSGSLVGGDMVGAPDRTLTLKAVVGAEMLGAFSFFQAEENDTINGYVDKFFGNIQKRPTAGGSPLDISSLSSGGFKKPAIFIQKGLSSVALRGKELMGTFSEFTELIANQKPNIRYVWGIKGNTLGFFELGVIEKTHVIPYHQILNNVDVSNGVTNIKVKGFFDDFNKIEISDGIIIKSAVKSQLNYIYQVIGMSLELANKEKNKWHITLNCVYSRGL